MACFIGWVFSSPVVAYYPALTVRECPHCKAHVVQEETISGNTIDANLYTDGKREALGTKCPHCEQEISEEGIHIAIYLYGIFFLVGKEAGYAGITWPRRSFTHAFTHKRKWATDLNL